MAVVRVFDLNPVPGRLVGGHVRRVLPLTNDSFQVHTDDLLELQTSIVFDMIEIKDSRALSPQQLLQRRFPFDEWKDPQVLAIEKQTIKGEEHALGAPEEQISEYRPARIVNTGDLAIEYRTFNPKMSPEPRSKILETVKDVPIVRDKSRLAAVDVRQGAKPVDFQFEEIFILVVLFVTAGKPHLAYVFHSLHLMIIALFRCI